MNIVFQISAFNDIEKIKTLVKYFKTNDGEDDLIIIIHINALSNQKLHNETKALCDKYKNIYIVPAISVKWSHISHVEQKIEGIKFLYDNNIDFDYYICITESDIPIKNIQFMMEFLTNNCLKSYFFDYFEEIKQYKQYFELLNKLDFKERLFKTFLILFNEINFHQYSLTHKWRWYFYGRNIEENTEFSKLTKISLKVLRFLFLILYAIPILAFVLNPTEKNYINAQKWQFGKKIKNVDIKIYSEWQYSITSFFSKKYCEFIYKNHKKYLYQFKDLYAPDESFWISMAKNFPDQCDDCVFDWKPMVLGLINLIEPKNGNEIKLAWDYNNFEIIRKFDKTNELFARKANSLTHMKDLMKFLKITNGSKD